MAQLVKCLPTKHEDLGLISRTHVKCHMAVAFADNLRDKRIPGAPWPAESSLIGEPQIKEKSFFKRSGLHS